MLDGDLPEPSFFKGTLPIIAADGAMNKLYHLDIKPNLVIGDLDSVQKEYLQDISTLEILDQNYSDYQKALSYLKNQNLLPAIVVGINGGYLDHILNNINIFLQANCLLYTNDHIGFVIRAKQIRPLTLPLNTKVSILGFSSKVSTKGLKWELNSYPLSFPGDTSCFNKTIEQNITILVEEGICLVLIYL